MSEVIIKESGMTLKQLYRLSKYSYQETFLDAMMQQMGANQARFAEGLNRNKNYARSQQAVMEVVMFIYSIVMIYFPYEAFVQINAQLKAGITSHWIFFAGSLSVSLFFLISFGFLLLFGMLQSSSLIGGDTFKWLATLPNLRERLKAYRVFHFFSHGSNSNRGVINCFSCRSGDRNTKCSINLGWNRHFLY